MIIVKIKGGLGNQFFQYALGRHMSIKAGEELAFDLTSFPNDKNNRRYVLDRFNITGRPAKPEEIKAAKPGIIRSYFEKLFPYYLRSVISERRGKFDPRIINNTRRNAYIDGYWQSYKYLIGAEDILKSDLTLKSEFSNVLEDCYLTGDILQRNSVAVHIRRGDYASDLKIRLKHGVLPLDYYKKAFEFLEGAITNPRYFIFSDDINWAKDNLAAVRNAVFVSNDTDGSDWFDFELMRKCRHIIAANSTFSWWAAWLNPNPEKIIIAPKHWYADSSKNTEDLVPSEWIRL